MFLQVQSNNIYLSMKNSKKFIGSSLTNSYQENVQVRGKVVESITRKAPLSLDESMSQTEMRKTRKAQMLLKYSEIRDDFQPMQMDKLILKNFKTGQQKYVEFDSTTQHSSDQELKIQYNIQQIVDLANKDPQPGKITFVAKLVGMAGVQFNYKVQNIRPQSHKEILEVQQVRSFGNFGIFDIKTNSVHKQIVIHLFSDKKKLASSKVLSFSNRSILINEDLSYDFQDGKKLQMNTLEGFLISCIIQGERLCQQILEIFGKNKFRIQIITGKYTIDQHTQALINANINPLNLLRMLKLFLQEDGRKFSKPTPNTKEESYKVLAKIFMQQVLKLKYSTSSLQEDIPQQEFIQYFQLFLHFICLKETKVINFDFDPEVYKQIKAKTTQIMKFSFSTGEVNLYHKYVKFCIDTKNYVLLVGFDTIKDYVTEFSIKSTDAVLASFQNILYHALSNPSKKVINMFLQTFLKSSFQSSAPYQSINNILRCASQVIDLLEPNTLALQNFNNLYTVYNMFRNNKQLVGIARNEAFRKIITDFIPELKQRIQRGEQNDKILGFTIIQRVYINERDDQIITNENNPLKTWIPFFFKSFMKNRKLLLILVKLLFEIIKRVNTKFSQEIVKVISDKCRQSFLGLSVQDALTLINPHFNQELLHIPKAIQIITTYLLGPLIDKMLPQEQKTLRYLKNDNHREWNHNFKYHLFINELIVEKMLKIVQKNYKNNEFQRGEAIKKMKVEITRSVQNQTDMNSLKAIVQIQLIELTVDQVWSYFTDKRGYLKILIKILAKNDQRSSELRRSLKKIVIALNSRKVAFKKIQKIKKMKNYEWTLFQDLTQNFDIPNLVTEIHDYGSNYISDLNQKKDFIRQIGTTFKCPDMQDKIEQIEDFLTRFVSQQVISSKIEENFTYFSQFNPDVLKCYKLQSFYGKDLQRYNGKNIEQMLQISNKLLVQLKKNLNQLFESFQNKSLKSSNFYYFSPRKETLKQFGSILVMGREEIPESIEDIVKIYDFITQSSEFYQLINGLTTIQAQRFKIKEPILLKLLDYSIMLQKRKDFNISTILQDFQQAKKKLKQYKLNIDDPHSKSLLKLLTVLTQAQEIQKLLKQIQPCIKDLKEKVDDVGGLVTYEDLEYCQIALNFFASVFNKKYNTFNDLMLEISKSTLDNKNINKGFTLHVVLKAIIDNSKSLKEQKQNLVDSNRSLFKIMVGVVKKSKFYFENSQIDNDKVKSKIFYLDQIQKKEEQIDEKKLFQAKQKAILMMSTTKQEDKQAKYKELPKFIHICKNFEQLKDKQQQLADWGYTQFERKPVVVTVQNYNMGQFQKTIQQREKKKEVWQNNVQKLLNNNYKAGHLQGKKLKEFYSFIMKNEQIPDQFKIINEQSNIHKEIKNQIKLIESKTPEECLQQTIKYFAKLKQKTKQQRSPDYDDAFVHFNIMAKDEGDFLRGIQSIDPKRIEKLKLEHLLSCTKETEESQLKSFIQRALRDPNNQYIILGFQNLDRKKQQFLIDLIRKYKEQLREEHTLKLKLCLVGDSQIDLLYKFAKEQLNEIKNSPQTKQQSRKAYKQKIIKQTNNVFIVSSQRAGYGKTKFIEQHSLHEFKCTEQYFVPLSGVMSVPALTEGEVSCQKFLWDRYNQIFRFFKSASQRKVKACLVFQIYNIQNQSVDSVNTFLTNIAIFKKHRYHTTTLNLPTDVPIYFQLQNISNSIKTSLKKKDLAPQFNTLPILKELIEICSKKIHIKIESFRVENLCIKENRELSYILTYLKSLKDKTINSNFIGPFPSNIKEIPVEEARALIRQYFFSKFEESDPPSGYLWTYFSSLLFAALQSFSKSLFLSQIFITSTDQDIKHKRPALHKQIKLKQCFREEFLNVIISNCHEFIQRSVRPGAEGEQSSLQQTLRNLPFLIIPNKDGESFSFIYNDSSKVPKTIKNLSVLQNTKLINQIDKKSIDDLFETINIAKIQKQQNNDNWKKRASQILVNISGNKDYSIDCEEGYIVNIDNFFKMCLITQRMRLNIPIVIMGEAGIGKTALLRHVVTHLYKHQFMVFNINAGLPLESAKQMKKQEVQADNNCNKSLTSMIEQIKIKYDQLPRDGSRKLWVFFDEFNTLRELGFFKEIIMDKRYLGQPQNHFKNIVMMAACNPHKKLLISEEKQEQKFVIDDKQKLAFDVLPAPHSLIESMWNYGALNNYEYEKYIGKMLTNITYKANIIPKLILKIHSQIKVWLYDSAVSLRDIDRLRQIYNWFLEYLPHLNVKNVKSILKHYNNREERALLMSLYFTYLLRFNNDRRQGLQKIIQSSQDGLNLPQGYIRAAKETEESDFCSRLNFKWDTPIALNNSLKENIYTSFVCIYTRLPLLIIGAPGSSKSISLRLLQKNLSSTSDEYLKRFKRIRPFQIQGSENSTTQEIKVVFQKAYSQLIDRHTKRQMTLAQMRDTFLILFDEIGLAQKSPDNPLKVLHPYLQVNRQDNLSTRMLSFIGISNSQLDVSKMSRLLVLRRPRATLQDLENTGIGIASGYQKENLDEKVQYIIKKLTGTYNKYLEIWKAKKNNYPLFYGLRDFYSLIKDFMSKIIEKRVTRDDNDEIVNCAFASIFENFNGWQDSYLQFKDQFCNSLKQSDHQFHVTSSEIIQNLIKILDKETNRYPLIIGQDQQSLLFIKMLIEEHYKERAIYVEGSPYHQEKQYSLNIIGDVYKYIEGQNLLILQNLKEGVQTGLYDFFNKSFNVKEDGRKFLRLKLNAQNYKMHSYNQKFNCVYLLLRKDLENVQPPFLSRFQKYRFNLSEYRNERCDNIYKKIQNFCKRIGQICMTYNLKHFKFNDLFVNVSEKAIESLAVSSYLTILNKKIQRREANIDQEENIDEYYRQAIRRIIMNSGQEFYFFFKSVIQKNNQLSQLIGLIQETINIKNEKQGDRNFIIKFTTDRDYIKKYEKSAENHCVEFQTFKKHGDIVDQLNIFLNHNKRKNLYIMMQVLKHSKSLTFIISEISRALKVASYENKNINQKKVRLVFLIEKNKVDQNGQSDQDKVISHFTNYSQEFDDGKLGQLLNSKEEMFKSVINMEQLLSQVHNIFEFQLQNPNNIKIANGFIKGIIKQLSISRDSIFQAHCHQIMCTLESNFQLTQEMIKQIMMDKELMEKKLSFRESITKYFADKKLFGIVSIFVKYLLEKEAYFSYSNQFLHAFLDSEGFILDQEIKVQFERAKRAASYSQFMKDLLKVKSTFIKNQYNQCKRLRRLPNIQKRYPIKVKRPRLVAFSKVECQILLNSKQKQLGYLAKQAYASAEDSTNNKAYEAYVEQFKKKTTFKNIKYNFYSKYIEEDRNLKTMLFLDLLADFAQLNGLNIKFVYQYYQIMLPIFYSQENNVKFPKMVCILLGLQGFWIDIFKLMSVLYQQDCNFQLKFKSKHKISIELMKQYFKVIIEEIFKQLLSQNCLKNFGNTEKFCRILINSLFHIQKIQKKIQLGVNFTNLSKLISIRTALVFLQLYDPANKSQNVEVFINQLVKNPHLKYHEVALNTFDSLKQKAKPEQIKLIDEFEANSLFLEWLKYKDPTHKNLNYFMQKCEKDERFAHNSVASINQYVQGMNLDYRDIASCFKKLNNKGNKDTVVQQLLIIGSASTKKNFKDNLSIVIINMFIQKIVAAFEQGDILLQKAKDFEEIVSKLATDQLSGLAKHFSFAFVKVFLQNYIQKFVRDDNKYRKIYEIVDKILSADTIYSSNYRFFCVKLLRTKMPITQVKSQYLKKNKCQWISLIAKTLDVFLENESRSIVVPKDCSSTAQSLKEAIKKTMQSDGKPEHFDILFAEGSTSSYNRYCLLNFFLRFYFSMFYNHKVYKSQVIAKLQKDKLKYSQLIGQIQFELIWRYANNKFDQSIEILSSQQFNQDIILFFNSINWLFSFKEAISPLHSLFFSKNGKLHQSFINAFQNQFFPCGPENPFINIAQTVYQLTRNNDIGIYLCSNTCDVLYCHQNCGWPNQTLKCPICGQDIGCKPPKKSHTIVKDELGARRIMSPLLKDSGSNFWVSSLSNVPLYFDAQRCYVESQINRMKQKSIVTAGGKQVKLKGYQVQNQGRVSSLSYYIVRQILNSIFYCLVSLKCIRLEQVTSIFKVKDNQEAKKYILQKHTNDMEYIKKALNLNNKIYGWMFGVHSFVFDISLNFKSKFNEYVIQTQDRVAQMIKNIQAQMATKAIKDVYHQLFKDIINSLKNGLITKQLQQTIDLTANNRFTRDTFEILLQRFIKTSTSQQKFRLAQQSFELQGCMQFPNDMYLTQDKLDQTKFQYSKMFKLPDKIIKYNEIILTFQLLIRQEYPFLDYILKNSDLINSINDMSNILLFSNSLFKQIANTYERIDADRQIGQFILELKKEKQQKMDRILKEPQIVVKSWNKMAKKLGQLQYKCTPMGKMNDQFSLQTPVKAFLIDTVSKKNAFGLTLAVVFCNFAQMHNDIVNILNTKKNQIPQYKCLNLLDDSTVLSPQQFLQSNVYTFTEKELEEKLYEFSISSVNYGRNFVFTNFEAYQEYFIKKLQGKCLFNTNLDDLKNICYNGQIFAKTSQNSNTLTEIKEYFDTPLTDDQRRQVQKIIRSKGSPKQCQECSIKIRGDLERIMLIIKKQNGSIEATTIDNIAYKCKLQFLSVETNEFGQIELNKIVALYQQFELEMKPWVIQKLNKEYKFKLSLNEQKELKELFETLPLEQNEQSVTLSQFGIAVFRFISRNLQGNMVENDVNLMSFLLVRQDFWPKDFDVYTKLVNLQSNVALSCLTLKNVCALFDILEGMIKRKVGNSKI